ncbi:MAG: bifunctional 5,10-methylenetetrahydrofolate dehydrogenase/5,10-methenyltetrahydrofolate cyclohydrolase [Candidatus Omnitrophica bacterium]|nr:bifunctional 5,10-methylenetetrahydrofolate dehydrogenase/5,10-methenyltetrahydrofolate cyclohydrolase [Candidatus Omnitrophota bacterium]
MAIIFNAQERCNSLLAQIKSELDSISKLCLASVVIGEDVAARNYCSAQEKLAKELKIDFSLQSFASGLPFKEFQSEIEKLNNDKEITGIILNKPFPPGWSDVDLFSLLSEGKDIEGMHPANLGRFFLGQPKFISPTALSVIELIKESGVKLYGAKVTLVGFSPLIGRPLTLWLGNEFATVSVTHIATDEKGDIPSYVSGADIVISAVGKPDLIKGDWIKKGAVVIDVGVGHKDRKVSGDVEFDQAKKRAAFITPVPGGVGKLTTIFLYQNLVLAYKLSLKN